MTQPRWEYWEVPVKQFCPKCGAVKDDETRFTWNLCDALCTDCAFQE